MKLHKAPQPLFKAHNLGTGLLQIKQAKCGLLPTSLRICIEFNEIVGFGVSLINPCQPHWALRHWYVRGIYYVSVKVHEKLNLVLAYGSTI